MARRSERADQCGTERVVVQQGRRVGIDVREIEHIAGCKICHGIGGRLGRAKVGQGIKVEDVVARSAAQDIDAAPATQRVVASPTTQRIGIRIASQMIRKGRPDQILDRDKPIGCRATSALREFGSETDIHAGGTVDTRRIRHRIGARATVQKVIPLAGK